MLIDITINKAEIIKKSKVIFQRIKFHLKENELGFTLIFKKSSRKIESFYSRWFSFNTKFILLLGT